MNDGVCHDCRQSILKGSRCPGCRERHREAEAKRKQRLREEGKCLFCGSDLLDDTFVLCLGCRLRRKQLREQVQQLNRAAREGIGTGSAA